MHTSKNLSIRTLDTSMNLIIRILGFSMDLSIRTLVILMKPFFGNSNSLFHMMYYTLRLTLMTKDIVIMLWFNVVKGRISQSLSLYL